MIRQASETSGIEALPQQALMPWLSCVVACHWFAEGRLQLTSVEAQPGCSRDELLMLAAAAERSTRHPLADALVAAAESRGTAYAQSLYC